MKAGSTHFDISTKALWIYNLMGLFSFTGKSLVLSIRCDRLLGQWVPGVDDPRVEVKKVGPFRSLGG